MGEEILVPVRGVGPGRVLHASLAPQVVGDAQSLQRAEPRDPLAPVVVLGVARLGPAAGDELLDAALNHEGILSRPREKAR